MIRDSIGMSSAALAVGITGAVEALVTVAHDRSDLFEPVDRRDDPLAELRMLLDELPLLGCERPRLRQDRLRNADLADVVEQRAELETLERTRVEAESAAHLAARGR